jgi:tRNA threonylcarbamoyladenosine biosynthesis protein TsaB
MLILALDTTTRAGSAAVLDDDRVLAERAGDSALTHGQRLPADLMRVLEAAGVALNAVELFAVAAGPGSFTGLRVGIATVQGLATAAQRRVVPVSTLDALAHILEPPPSHLAAWMDAQRGEVFATLYDASRRPIAGPTSANPEATLTAWSALAPLEAVTFIGDGAVRYADVIRARAGGRASLIEPAPLLAGAIGRIASRHRDGAVLPHAVVPIYVRKPDAELARARRRAAGGA